MYVSIELTKIATFINGELELVFLFLQSSIVNQTSTCNNPSAQYLMHK
jgi:hypothetical protein